MSSVAPSSVAGVACTTSFTGSSSTVTTVSPTSIPVRSVYTILDPIPTATQTLSSAPATITRDPETPLRDEALPTPRLPSTPGTPQIPVMSPPSLPPPVFHLSDHSPTVSQPSVLRINRYPVPVPVFTVSSSVPLQVPGFQSPLTVAYPDTTQASVIQTFPQFTAFDTLFPKIPFLLSVLWDLWAPPWAPVWDLWDFHVGVKFRRQPQPH